MEFRILGPVEAVDNGRALRLGGPKPRALLVHLLLEAGRAVSRERLVDELWGDRPPPTARDSLNVHAGLLRRALGPRLHTVADGYLLEADAAEIDATALTWYLGEGWDPQVALAMAGPLWWFWYMRGLVGEGRSWLQRSLAATPSLPSRERGLALRATAALARIMGDFTEALSLGEEALSVFRAVADDRGVAAALNNLCISALSGGELEGARRHGEEGLRVIEQLGEEQGMAASRNNLGIVARNLGELDEAEALFAEARRGFAGGGNHGGEAAALSNLAIVGRLRGDVHLARGLALEALRFYTEIGFDEGKLDCLELLAALAAGDDPALALRLLTVTARTREQLNATLFTPDEIEQVAQAEATARRTLGPERADEVLERSRLLTLDDAVRRAFLDHAYQQITAGAKPKP